MPSPSTSSSVPVSWLPSFSMTCTGQSRSVSGEFSNQNEVCENQPPAITGYQASNTVNVKVRDLSKLGKVLDALVASGANQINGPTFGIENPEPLYEQARLDALKAARAIWVV